MKVKQQSNNGAPEENTRRSIFPFSLRKHQRAVSTVAAEPTNTSVDTAAVPAEVSVKLLVCGDAFEENNLKNLLLHIVTKQQTGFEYVPIFHDTSVKKSIGGQLVRYELCSTSGTEDYDRLRQDRYALTNVVLLAFHYNHRMSFDNATTIWLDEIKAYLPKVPVVLVGVKDNYIQAAEGHGPAVQTEDAAAIAKKKKVDVFVECSVEDLSSVNTVFDHALFSALLSDKKTKILAESANVKCSEKLEKFSLIYFNTFGSKTVKSFPHTDQKSSRVSVSTELGSSAKSPAKPLKQSGLFRKPKISAADETSDYIPGEDERSVASLISADDSSDSNMSASARSSFK